LGRAEKVVVSRKAAMIVKGRGTSEEVEVQIQKIRNLIENANNPADREGYEERIAKLTSGVSVIRVGAKTEVEGREKVERVKDAVGAAQSALKEGIVPGSGVTFLRMAAAIKGDSDGEKLLKEVLEAPLKKVMENCGEPDKLIKEKLAKIKEHEDIDYSYEAMNGDLTNLYKVGVIDPTKVIRLCLENGIGVATSVLTTDTIIDFDEPKLPGQQ
jgi:chaperonin GroEL